MIPIEQQVLEAYGLEGAVAEPFGSGLINRTWKVAAGGRQYILQRINEQVFKEPQNIADNIRAVAGYLKANHPEYFFVAPLPALSGTDTVQKEGWFRLFPFVAGAHAKEVVASPAEAFEAARQFGRFTRLLANFDVQQLKTTIPQFHDLSLRYRQFEAARDAGDQERRKSCSDEIRIVQEKNSIAKEYDRIVSESAFRLRVTHHDTKISNVLFDAGGRGLCVIDLDTVMPGYFISDLGDMMRTYLSPVSEEETDFSKIEVRPAFYKAVVDGYFGEMKEELNSGEQEHVFYAGEFMIYMQALRFLTDHLNNDRYYGAQYPGHNLLRARNQLVLLERLQQQKDALISS
jgi:Ser/Thr protein kinase RdoA (MazF antagonist)